MNITIKETVTRAEDALSICDPELGVLINRQKPVIHYPRTDYFSSLCRSILGQQVSVASAKATYVRLEQATSMQPLAVTSLSDEQARGLGLSRQKAGYIRDLGTHFANQPNIYNHLENLSDDQIIKDLTEVKGIGVWTAQMFLMFTLTRLDVFAPDDIGIQRAMKQFYGWNSLPKREELIKFAQKWKPYRTIACWHLWESLHHPEN